eukprot:3517570-Pyramimonas_sp.AAC.1
MPPPPSACDLERPQALRWPGRPRLPRRTAWRPAPARAASAPPGHAVRAAAPLLHAPRVHRQAVFHRVLVALVQLGDPLGVA